MSKIDEDAFAKIIAKDSWLKPHDIFQWRSIIEAYEKAKGGEWLAKLQHEYDSTRGLWCIDRDPSEVEHEWIKQNAFQLK